MTNKIIALDTSTEACSVAFYQNGQTLADYRLAPRQHGQYLLPMISRLLAKAGASKKDVDIIAWCHGPGSFTGLRIAAAVVQGLAYGLGLPVVSVSTLAVLAQGAYRLHNKQQILTAIDARMAEVYWANYRINQQGIATLLGQEAVIKPQQIPALSNQHTDMIGVGSGWRYQQILCQCLGRQIACEQAFYPQAEDIIPLALSAYQRNLLVPAEQAVPVYLRNQVV
jgi:tRNA threonylcarbamoyladenosine biosynthesis protein TsaB